MLMLKKYHLLPVIILIAHLPFDLIAEEQSINPGINHNYKDPDWHQWVNTFERPGREVFDRRHAIIEASDVRPGMAIADIGAGTGLFTKLFAIKTGHEGKVYAVDISPSFIKNILRISQQLGMNNVEGIVNSDKDVSLAPDSIDLAFITDTYHHFEYPVSMLTSIYEALRPGGRMIIIDFVRDPKISTGWVMSHVRADKKTVIKEITRAGFEFIGEKPVLRQNYFLVFARGK